MSWIQSMPNTCDLPPFLPWKDIHPLLLEYLPTFVSLCNQPYKAVQAAIFPAIQTAIFLAVQQPAMKGCTRVSSAMQFTFLPNIIKFLL